jgi:hypothetical protein
MTQRLCHACDVSKSVEVSTTMSTKQEFGLECSELSIMKTRTRSLYLVDTFFSVCCSMSESLLSGWKPPVAHPPV